MNVELMETVNNGSYDSLSDKFLEKYSQNIS